MPGKKRSYTMKTRIHFGTEELPESQVRRKKGGEGLRMAIAGRIELSPNRGLPINPFFEFFASLEKR
jgi:hypothetical protein